MARLLPLKLLVWLASVFVASLVCAAETGLKEVHFLIPGGAGGGWDATARGTGEALMKSGLVEIASYENMSGASGGKGVSHMVETALQNQHVLMVNSTPIVIRSLMPVFGQSWRNLTPIAAVIGDYGAVMVRADSPYQTFAELLAVLNANPRSVKVSGGSTRGGLDHLIIASVFKQAGLNPMNARYVPYDGGGQAMMALLAGEVSLMSATVGDAINLFRDGKVRILGVAAPQRLPEIPSVPTFTELGLPLEFINWRGYFAVPNLPAGKRRAYVALLNAMRPTDIWKTVLKRNGWVENFIAGAEFEIYLEKQEAFIGALMKDLGFIQ